MFGLLDQGLTWVVCKDETDRESDPFVNYLVFASRSILVLNSSVVYLFTERKEAA